jgi:hypothetical protein
MRLALIIAALVLAVFLIAQTEYGLLWLRLTMGGNG